MGRHQHRLLCFALRYPDAWHPYGRERATVRALRALADLGYIRLNDKRQFSLAKGSEQ